MWRTLVAESVSKWRDLLAHLITTCFEVAEVVAPIVNNSSPEGNIPDDVCIGDSVEGWSFLHRFVTVLRQLEKRNSCSASVWYPEYNNKFDWLTYDIIGMACLPSPQSVKWPSQASCGMACLSVTIPSARSQLWFVTHGRRFHMDFNICFWYGVQL